jgi:hypothetical protein
MSTHQPGQSIIEPGVIYGDFDRYVCIDCLGMGEDADRDDAVLNHGQAADGTKVEPVDIDEALGWYGYNADRLGGGDLGPLRCEGGHLEAVIDPTFLASRGEHLSAPTVGSPLTFHPVIIEGKRISA